jgi:hypothetical protein
VISDSIPWKRRLSKHGKALSKRTVQRRWGSAAFTAVEFDVFLAAYAIRKLSEAKKLSDEVEAMPIKAYSRSLVGGPVDHMNSSLMARPFERGRRLSAGSAP